VLRQLGVECGPGEDPVAKLTQFREQQAHVQQRAAAAEKLSSSLAGYAASEMAKLSPERQAAVRSVAGDNPGSQLDVIRAFLPTWLSAPAAAPAAPAAAPAAPAAAPAAPPPQPPSTALPPQAPPPATPTKVDHLATYERLLKQNPMHAGLYMSQHAAAITAAQRDAARQRAS